MHKRQAIRDAFAAAVTGLTTTGNRVYVSRVYPLDTASLPALVIYTKREASAPDTIGLPRTFTREITLSCEAYVRGVDGYDDLLDTIAAEVETALYAAGDFGGLIKDAYLLGTDVNYQDGADQPLASADIEITFIYTTVEGSVTV